MGVPNGQEIELEEEKGRWPLGRDDDDGMSLMNAGGHMVTNPEYISCAANSIFLMLTVAAMTY